MQEKAAMRALLTIGNCVDNLNIREIGLAPIWLRLCIEVAAFQRLSMDLSKAFDSVDYNLLLAKLNAYGINLDALQLLRYYLSKRHQRVKVNSTFSE